MKHEVASGDAGHDAAVYQAAARDVWRAAEEPRPARLTVTSDSMRPLLRVGDGVVVQPIDPHALQPGDVIVVRRGGDWITHRLVTVDERGWHTHGDNTRYGDEAASAAQARDRDRTERPNDRSPATALAGARSPDQPGAAGATAGARRRAGNRRSAITRDQARPGGVDQLAVPMSGARVDPVLKR
jgi:hypothetical protein